MTLSAETTGTHPTMNKVQINSERKKEKERTKEGRKHAKAFRKSHATILPENRKVDKIRDMASQRDAGCVLQDLERDQKRREK